MTGLAVLHSGAPLIDGRAGAELLRTPATLIARIAGVREGVAVLSREKMQFAEDRHSLARERHHMRRAGLLHRVAGRWTPSRPGSALRDTGGNALRRFHDTSRPTRPVGTA